MDKLHFQHAKAVNLARRFSEMNENDLVMVRSHVLPWILCFVLIAIESMGSGSIVEHSLALEVNGCRVSHG